MSNLTCSVQGCESQVRCKDLCNKHYLRFRNHGDPLKRLKPEGKQSCTAPECMAYAHTKGLCVKHSMRMRRTGSIADPERVTRSCEIEGCGRKHYARSMCKRHYLRAREGLELRLPGDIVNGGKLCTRCLLIFPVESFGTSVRLAGGKNIYCSSCLSDLSHIRRANKRANEYESVSRDVVLSRDMWICHLCDGEIPADAQWPHPLSASMDHVIPLSKGGAHTYENIKSSHLTCNISKGARIPA